MEESMEHSASGGEGKVVIAQQDGETGVTEAVWPKNPRLSPIGAERSLGLSAKREREVMSSLGLNTDSPPFSPNSSTKPACSE